MNNLESNMKRLLTYATLMALFFTSSFAIADNATPTERSLNNLRNKRYCEVISAKLDFIQFDISVYSTVKLDDCPENLWKQLTADKVKKQLHSDVVKLNGPRYWTLDGLVAYETPVPTITIGGIQFAQRGAIDTYIWQGTVGKFYRPNVVKRTTIWIYKPYTRVYELVDPHGNIYVMQSYSQIIDPNLQISELVNLGSRLKLPKGWKYQTRILTKELRLKAEGIAYVLSDNFYNSYQRE